MMSSKNRFAVFMEDEDMDSEVSEEVEHPILAWPEAVREVRDTPRSPLSPQYICRYSLTAGTESVHHVRSAPVQQVGSINTFNAISFFGRCFQCQYMSHSQKYCPLRQCKACKQYGHSETVCRRQKSAVRTFLDSVERANGLHGLLLTEVADADAETEAESGAEGGDAGGGGGDADREE